MFCNWISAQSLFYIFFQNYHRIVMYHWVSVEIFPTFASFTAVSSFTSLMGISLEMPAKFNSTFRHSSCDTNPSLFSEPFHPGNSFVTSLKFETLALWKSRRLDTDKNLSSIRFSKFVICGEWAYKIDIKIDFFTE